MESSDFVKHIRNKQNLTLIIPLKFQIRLNFSTKNSLEKYIYFGNENLVNEQLYFENILIKRIKNGNLTCLTHLCNISLK